MNRAQSLSAPAVPAHSSFRLAQWRMLLAAMFCYLFFYTGRQTFGFAIPGIQAEFGLSKETLGWISAAMLWAYAIGQAINGSLADSYGGRRIMSLGAVLSCAANWLTSFATGFISLILPWALNGYLQALGWAPGSRLLSNWWGVSERGKVYGFYVFAAGCASILSYVTSMVVLEVLHLEWRWIFRLPVLLMLAGGILFYLIARDRPQDLGFEPLADTGVANADDKGHEVASDAQETAAQRYKAVLKNVRLLIAAVSLGFQNAARYGLIVWVPVHFLGADWKHGDGWIDPKWITVALPVGMAVGALSNGWISDRLFGSKRYLAIMLYMVLGAATSLWMWSLPAHSGTGLAALFLCGFFVYGPASSFWALCPDLVGARRAGTATGVMNFSSYLFAGLCEPLIGSLLDSTGNTSLIFIVVASACVGSAVVALFVRR
ncbi:MFS transporter [Pseudomonas sp. GD04058]|uniref:MFS transporter n=1 Tax=Pseudomonas sp. GD04058 TaxID=2975429 RepID=UPI00244855BF|nr:MFS transporter [Pseudomonas sp. GD04058]MDG9885732.1 MFS transporter [Pseudomonas sp. GD04058]